MEGSSGLVLIIIGVCLILLYCKCYEQMNTSIGKHSVNGRVIKIEFKDKKYLLTVKYTIDDKEYVNKVISKRQYQTDDRIPIIYNKKNPNKIKLDLFKSFYGEGEGELIGMMCTFCCIPMFLFALVGIGFENILKS